MPKFNPKRKARNQQPESPPPSPSEKKSGTYKRGSPKLTKFYGIIIIAAIGTGLFFLLSEFMELTPSIRQWDHVQLRLKLWIYPEGGIYPGGGHWNESITPDKDITQWYNFTTVYEVSTDTNGSVYKEGLPLGIYERLPYQKVGGKSPAFQIMNCMDTDKDQKDDKTGFRADGWGFAVPDFEAFVNKTIVVMFEVIAIVPHT